MHHVYLFDDTLNDSFGRPKAQEDKAFVWLRRFLDATKGTQYVTGRLFEDGRWWVQFTIDLEHKLAWTVIQELAYVANNKAMIGKLPVKLIPWTGSPENGPPKANLAWRIECYDGTFSPDDFVAEAGAQVKRSVTPWPPKN